MSLAFLSPAAEGAPTARGPLADAAAAAGAVVEARAGWEVATSFGDPAAEAAACRETVGFADLSQIAKLELQGAPAALDVALAGATLDMAAAEAGGWGCRVRPALGLALGDAAAGVAAAADVRTLDLTAALGAIAIAGPRARDAFARFCALDLRDRELPVRGFRPGSVARTPGYVLREGDERFLMIFGAAYGAYVWEVVADAVDGLGGRPVGLDALPAAAPTAIEEAARA